MVYKNAKLNLSVIVLDQLVYFKAEIYQQIHQTSIYTDRHQCLKKIELVQVKHATERCVYRRRDEYAKLCHLVYDYDAS